MNVTQIEAPIRLDGIKDVLESMMVTRTTQVYAFTSQDPTTVPIGESNEFVFLRSGSAPVNATANGYNTLAYNQIAGRLEFPSLTTTNLPNGRRFWISFGQLCADVFFGRIPELVTASSLILDQLNKVVLWGDTLAQFSTVLPTSQAILVATESKISSDFFE